MMFTQARKQTVVRSFLRLQAALLMLTISLNAISAENSARTKKPNIIVMLADDMGYSDLASYGGEVRTPNIDRLATNGLRFTQFYNTGRCCPTRASLLTGVYPHQAGVPHMVDNLRLPLEKRQLSQNTVTIAEVLKAKGYRTGMSGKWHVAPVDSCDTNGPMQRGFERFYGIVHGAASYYDPVTLRRNHEKIRAEGPNFFLTDAIAANAASQMKEFNASGQPFFLYVAFTAPHWPLHAPAEDLAPYTNIYKKGWDRLREERHARQKELKLLPAASALTGRDPRVAAWETVKNKEWEAHRMAVYAAQIERMDRGVGTILRQLEQLDQLENTLILFLADNGACAEILGPRQNALHVPKQAPGGGPMRLGNDPSIFPGGADTYASYGIGWANLGNTPFRLYKHWVHEGGISTPLVAHWPAGITKPGFRSDPGHLIDILATCTDAAGADYPAIFEGRTIVPLEGKSLLPVFRGEPIASRMLFWEHEGNRAVRSGDWKLVSRFPGEWELYDLKKDRSETKDLAAQCPEKVTELIASYEAWARRAEVADWAELQKRPVVR